MRSAAFAFLSILVFLASCTPPQQAVHNLSPEQTAALLAEKESKNLYVLNVHTPYEGELEGTDAIIEDWQNIAMHVDKLPQDKTQPVLVYCRTGRMSTSAVEQLKALGYTEIYHADGGMRAYQETGLPGLLNYSGG